MNKLENKKASPRENLAKLINKDMPKKRLRKENGGSRRLNNLKNI